MEYSVKGSKNRAHSLVKCGYDYDTLQKLPSMQDYGMNFYRATIFPRMLTHRHKFFFLFLNLDAVPKNLTLDILTYWASWNLEIYQTIIVSVMFSLPLIVAYVPSYLESKTDIFGWECHDFHWGTDYIQKRTKTSEVHIKDNYARNRLQKSEISGKVQYHSFNFLF